VTADIVTELTFSTSDYYKILNNFITGFNASERYTRLPACQASFINLIDKFYELE